MAKITRVWANEILDSRGYPTVEAVIVLDSGLYAVASSPAGVTSGKYEALELRDAQDRRYVGFGVRQAVNNVVNVLGPALIGMDPINQFEIDQKMVALDGTPNKSKLGVNSILSVSMAVSRAASMAANVPLYRWVNQLASASGIQISVNKVPIPIFNIIEGGQHGAGNLDFQEFQAIPSSAKRFYQSLQMGAEIYHATRESLARRGAIHSVGDEGGYAPNLFTNADAFRILMEAVSNSGYQLGQDVFLGLDVAANQLFDGGRYSIKDRTGGIDSKRLIEFYDQLYEEFKLLLLEDPLQEDDWEGWKAIMNQMGSNTLVAGDDLLVSNPSRVQQAVSQRVCNTIVVKPNQVGTVTEVLGVIKLAKDAGWRVIVSHRTGETNDWFLADFAVGVASDYVKFGALARGERVAKYNRLLSIEQELAAQAQSAGG